MDLIHSYGATMVPVSREESGSLGSIRRAEAIARERANVCLPNQFSNAAAHEISTGAEIGAQLGEHGLVAEAWGGPCGPAIREFGCTRCSRPNRPR